jgi:transposase-like protein
VNSANGIFLSTLHQARSNAFDLGPTMLIYYPSLQAIHQQTLQLESEACHHCRQTHHLVSHGFIRKKRAGAEPEAVGKRVFCSNRYRHTGCGRTMQLYLDTTIRYLHHASGRVMALLGALLAGSSIARAYREATGTDGPRHAYRWLQRFVARMSDYRRLLQHPPLMASPQAAPSSHAVRRGLLSSTFSALQVQLGQPLCQRYQALSQQPFF